MTTSHTTTDTSTDTSTDTTTDTTTADQALKAKHRAMWALGDYPAVVTDLVAPLGPVLVQACRLGPDDHVLDVAAGSGNAAIPAARAGARVVASDLTPELLDAGRAAAQREGLELQWSRADAEALPFADAEFDVVLSCLGVMFAPHHERSAAEILRVCRPGGTIGLLSWTPQGFIGQMFATMKPYAPPPPPGARPAPLWGDEAHVRGLFGDGITDVTVRRDTLAVDHFTDGVQLRDYFKSHYGPTIVTYRRIADDPAQVDALDEAMAQLGEGRGPNGSTTPREWEYLLLTARRT